MKITRTVVEEIEISREEELKVFSDRLEQMTRGYWISDGKLHTEGYTSHSFNYVIEPLELDDYGVVYAACLLRQRLMEQKHAAQAKAVVDGLAR